MCGEHPWTPGTQKRTAGSSPHVRGAPCKPKRIEVYLRIIPACAGSTTTLGHGEVWNTDHPRMCGEHTKKILLQPITLGRLAHY